MTESRLYSFLDNKKAFGIHFLDGTKLLSDLQTIHNIGPHASNYYKETILTAQHMITFLKPGESLGVYIDSEDPYFRFKIEMGHQGTMRTLLLPEEFEKFPKKVSGLGRVAKIFPNQTPYTSIVKLDKTNVHDIINLILNDSYQTNSQTELSQSLNQSIMITKLPAVNVDKEGEAEDDISLLDFTISINAFIDDLFQKETSDSEIIINAFEQKGFSYLGSKEVKFHCPCSKERMMNNLLSLSLTDRAEIFEKEKVIEVRCDYCNTEYHITEDNLNKVQ